MLLVSPKSVFLSHIGLELSVFDLLGASVWWDGSHRFSNAIVCRVGGRIFLIGRDESRRGTGLVRGKWSRFNARFFGFK